jgi:putative Holliday junction resolvase
MGLDLGDKTIGVAISDELGFTAQAVEVIRRKRLSDDFLRIHELIQEYQVTEIIVGFPKNMNNTVGPRGELSIQFSQDLAASCKLPVHLWDERLTTQSATKTLIAADVSRKKRKQVIDKMAAALILQSYMDGKQNRRGER